jgi:hypothetical protein
VSEGIQIGPGTDLSTKTAGGRGFTTYVYPNIIHYGLRGNIKTAGDISLGAYMWPGTQSIEKNVFPDPSNNESPAYFRVQQPCIISGISCGTNSAPNVGSITFEIFVSREEIINSTNISITMSGDDTSSSKYDVSYSCKTGDRIHLKISYTGGNDNAAHDLTVQIDLF